MRWNLFCIRPCLLESSFIVSLICTFGDATDYVVYKGFRNGTKFECGKDVTLQCQFQSVLRTFNWYIALDARSTIDIAARCFNTSTTCQRYPPHPASYNFMFDSQGQNSNVTITPVTSNENNLQFFCNDLTSNKIFEASVVALPTNISHLQNGTEFKVITDCVYPANLTKIEWYSSNLDGTGYKEHAQTEMKTVKCTTASNNCVIANESEEVTSILKLSIPQLQTGQTRNTRLVAANFIFDNGKLFNLTVGTYTEPDKAETTTYSTVKLTPTPTIVISSTPTPVITPTQTIVISPTPTTVVSPISTIVVAPSSTDKPPSNFPSTTDRKKSVIIGSSTGGGVILIIIISAGVCYIKRKRRNKKKAKKHMLSKEDTNVQEIKL